MAVSSLPKLKDSIPCNEDVAKYRHLRKLSFPRVGSGEVELLIRANMYEALHINGVRSGRQGEPQAIHTSLGWALFGVDRSVRIQDNQSFINCCLKDNANLHHQMLQMFDREFVEDHPEAPAYSVEDRRALKIMENKLKKKDGHYSIGLPWKEDKADSWFHGPHFLRQPESLWAIQPTILFSRCDDDPEIRRSVVKTVNLVQELSNKQNKLLHHYSSFKKLQRATAWLTQYKSYMIDKYLRKKEIATKERFLSPSQMQRSTMDIIRMVQQEAFPDLIKNIPKLEYVGQPTSFLTTNTKLYKSDTLYRLRPFLYQGIIRVEGRIQRSPLPFETKHQILLPYRHHITDIIITQHHLQQGHCGTLQVLAATREKYWIIKGHSAVKRALKDCRICRFWNSKVSNQMMAPLPVDRVTPGTCPFTSVGIDYMGPLLVKVGRSHVKRFGCIFTCMATRAVHIEIAYSLETSSFISCFRRFINRRGSPATVRSDNGTNFVGAERELREGLQRLNQNQITNSMTNEDIKWILNPPAASHQGGIWERVIRSVRKIMRHLSSERILNDEQLHTLMTEIERILNDRPLIPVSTIPDDFEALTPSSILLGRLDSSLAPDQFIKADGYKRSWRVVQWLADQFWQRWMREYLLLLQSRQKWLHPNRNITKGDLVLIVNEYTRRGSWPKGLIEQTFPDADGLVRRVTVRTATNTLDRDVRKICLLEEA
ncbi:uncharacterized protein LOC144751035 [Ciona intestinalis]